MDLVIVPFHDYKKWEEEGYRTRDAHLYKKFESDERVRKILVVNRPTSLAEVLIKNKKKFLNKGEIVYRNNRYQITRVNSETYVLDIFLKDFFKVIFERKKWWYSALSYNLVSNIINKAMIDLDMQNTVLYLQNPMSINLAKTLNVKIWGFDAIDNWLTHPQMGNIKSLVNSNYEYINNNADFITTVSESLCAFFYKSGHSYWIPNGVDKDIFFLKECYNENIKVCYVGKIQDRVNISLIEKCLDKFSNVDFYLVGPILSQNKKIKFLAKKYNNFHIVGDIHYDTLPEVLSSFDIGIIPHHVNEFTNSMNPLKLYEYLASGLPVLTTPCAGVNNISPYVHIVESENGFVSELGDIIKQINLKKYNPKDVMESIEENIFWDSKSNEIISIMENKLKEK
ncbi:glycosyltransferase [Enterococcus casseliflavus]|uniref:glycosyltransferase n=1 Tax=Enterococcus casseliflavus TaxID=37734 RepID=UPI00398F9283